MYCALATGEAEIVCLSRTIEILITLRPLSLERASEISKSEILAEIVSKSPSETTIESIISWIDKALKSGREISPRIGESLARTKSKSLRLAVTFNPR